MEHSTLSDTFRILRVYGESGQETDFKVPAVLLLASEVWEPLASGDPAYKSKDFVIPLPGEKASEIALLLKWLTRDNSFQITPDNFFSLARLADKFIISHLTSLLTYFSHTLMATTKPTYDLWLSAARHDMSFVEKTCRHAARLEVAQILAEKGVSYFIVEKGVSPAALDGIIMDLMKLKDNYIAHRQVRGGVQLALN